MHPRSRFRRSRSRAAPDIWRSFRTAAPWSVLRGEIQHKNLWLVDPETGEERPLTNLGADFNVSDFDISRDGRQIVLERTEDQSNVTLLDLRRRE